MIAPLEKFPRWVVSLFIFGILVCCGSFLPRSAFAATLSLSPAIQTVTVGQTFVATVYVSSPDEAMNAVSGDISFPTNQLRVLSLSESNSIVNFWVQNPSYSNLAGDGDISFQGVVLSPGFTGNAGAVLKITFQALTPGAASVSFSSGSILANDGNGTNILSSMEGSTFTTIPASAVVNSISANGNLPPAPIVTSPTDPDPNQWYNGKTLDLSWVLPTSVDGVSYALYSTSDFVLPSTSDGLLPGVSYDLTNYHDGIWYFYVKFHGTNGWGPTTVRQVKLDFSPPNPFAITYENEADPTNPQPTFTWATTDALSGVAKYTVKIGDGDWFDASTILVTSTSDQYQLPLQAPEKNVLLAVRAYDNAGNMTESTTTFSVAALPTPIITSYSNQLPVGRPVLTVEGSVAEASGAPPVTAVNIYLRKSDDVVSYTTPVDQEGNWNFEKTVELPSGLWVLTVQATDMRGALSLPTVGVWIAAGGWFMDIAELLLSWLAIILLTAAAIAMVVAFGYLLMYRLGRWRLSLSRELIKERKELHDDLVRIEKELETGNTGNTTDLSDHALREKQELVRKEIEHLENDLKRDIKDME